MKIRFGFVSNSSSSSFIIIANDIKSKNINLRKDIQDYFEYPNLSNRDIIINSNFGNNEFGWEHTQYFDWTDKVMWSYMQALYANRQDFVGLLSYLIKEKTKCKSIKLDIDNDGQLEDCYIDHQSVGDLSMFKNKETLNRFIFDKRSYIQGGNDNE